MGDVLMRKDDRQAKRGASRRARQVSGASRAKAPFDWSRVFSPLKKIVVIACVCGLGVTAYQTFDAYQLEHLTIKTVHINGGREYNDQNEVTKIISAYTQNDFFNLKIESMRDRLMGVSWVKAVSLRKQWPDRLVVNIEEHQPVAYWKDENNTNYLLSKTGRRFESEFALPSGMPKLSGQNENIGKIMNQYKHISLALLNRKMSITAMSLNTRHEWLITLNNGVDVKYLDDDADVALSRMLLAFNVLAKETSKRAQTIDLRYEHGFAVRWREDENV